MEDKYLHQLQNEGEIDFFTVNKLNNDNDKAENIWTLTSPETHDWAEGRVEVKSDGDRDIMQYCNIVVLENGFILDNF